MKHYLCTAFAATLLLLGSCGGDSTDETIDRLRQARGEWTVEQSDEAVDIYLEGLQRESDLLEQNLEIQRQVNFFSEGKCSREVLAKHRAEIDKARKDLQEKRTRLEQKLR
ncbi:MAG: hypothetical protein J6L73_07350 [Muribaculaceae bacterium]|nr:hypothetical protein [Muribaculaceae bacterium]